MERQRILIVDHDPNVARGLAVLAQRYGYETKTVSNAPEAIAQLRERKPDLLVLDLQLDRSSAWDVIRFVRTDRAFDQMVIITSSDGEAHPGHTFDAGIQDRLSKCDAFETFGELLTRHLADSKARS